MTERLTELLIPTITARSALQALPSGKVSAILQTLATELKVAAPEILAANAKDCATLDTADPRYDRVLLTPARLESLAESVATVAELSDPVGLTLTTVTRPNGLKLEKRSVPFGTVAVIYEARPNVTVDVFALCLKSHNVAILKGGREAQCTSEALVAVIHRVLTAAGVPTAACTLLPADRELTTQLVAAREFVDLLIPRGSQQLIGWVRERARVPMIETGAGVCHTYLDAAAEIEMAQKIVVNAKTRRVSVCNALDTLIVHASLLPTIDRLTDGLIRERVELRADTRAFNAMTKDSLVKRATPEDFGTEFLDRILAIKTVDSLDEALAHIAEHGSSHSEAIVTNDSTVAEKFLRSVDAACVYHNASTAFTDGGEFGMGAEIGISTQKLHARGPMALAELTTYKWIVRGNGQVRPN